MNHSFHDPKDTVWSKELVATVNLICNCIGVNIVCVFGLIGNIINTIVLHRHGFKDSTNILLFSLSISDLILVVTLPLGRLHCLVSQFDHALATSIQSTATLVLLTINRGVLFATLCHVGVISVERFVAIFFPFHVSRVFTPRRMRNVVISIYTINFLTLSPWFGAFYLGLSTDPTSNKTVAYARLTEFYSKNEYELNVYGAVSNFTAILISLIVVTVCCLAIAIKLFINTTKRADLVGQDRSKHIVVQNMKISKMLLTICLIFYAIFFPTTVMDLYLYLTIPNNILVDPRYVVVQYISDLVYCINSSVNFLIYVTMSTKYYRTYLQLLMCGTRKKTPKPILSKSDTP